MVDLRSGSDRAWRGGEGSKSRSSTLVSCSSGRCDRVWMAGSDVMAGNGMVGVWSGQRKQRSTVLEEGFGNRRKFAEVALGWTERCGLDVGRGRKSAATKFQREGDEVEIRNEDGLDKVEWMPTSRLRWSGIGWTMCWCGGGRRECGYGGASGSF